MYICTDDSKPFALQNELGPVVQKVDNAGYIISIRWIAQLFFLMLIRRWTVIYPVNGAIQCFNNGDLECKEAPSM